MRLFLLYNDEITTCCFNDCLGTCRESRSLYGELLGELAANDNLLARQIELCAVFINVESTGLNDFIIRSESAVVETTLRELAVNRELTAFEAGSYTAAGASVLTLVTLTGSLAVT